MFSLSFYNVYNACIISLGLGTCDLSLALALGNMVLVTSLTNNVKHIFFHASNVREFRQ